MKLSKGLLRMSELSVYGLKRAQGLWAWPLVVITCGSVGPPTTLGCPQLTWDGVLGKDC